MDNTLLDTDNVVQPKIFSSVERSPNVAEVIGSCSNRLHQSQPWSELLGSIGLDFIPKVLRSMQKGTDSR